MTPFQRRLLYFGPMDETAQTKVVETPEEFEKAIQAKWRLRRVERREPDPIVPKKKRDK